MEKRKFTPAESAKEYWENQRQQFVDFLEHELIGEDCQGICIQKRKIQDEKQILLEINYDNKTGKMTILKSTINGDNRKNNEAYISLSAGDRGEILFIEVDDPTDEESFKEVRDPQEAFRKTEELFKEAYNLPSYRN